MNLSFVDGDVGVGLTAFALPAARDAAALLRRLDRYGIAEALVHDRAVLETADFRSHDFILDFCKGSDRLHPVLPIVPPATGEQLPPREFVAFCRANGVKAVRASPKVHRFSFDPPSLGPLLGELEAHRMPVFYNSMALQDHPWEHSPGWADIRAVATAYPQLPVIVVFTGMLQGRMLYPLLATCPNVLVDLTCVSFQFIEDVVERFGPERLIMASHFPVEDPALYTTWVSYARIGEEARAAIAGGNLRRLLEAAR